VSIKEPGGVLLLCRSCALRHLDGEGQELQGQEILPSLQASMHGPAPGQGGVPAHVVVLAIPSEVSQSVENVPDIHCPDCRLSFKEFLMSGFFSCPGCYDAFSREIRAHLAMAGKPQFYRGKVPARAFKHLKMKKLIGSLKGQLDDEVRHENYETAARLRDTIRNLEGEVERYSQNTRMD
jgi:protein-arginine kinase activator protein McsA